LVITVGLRRKQPLTKIVRKDQEYWFAVAKKIEVREHESSKI
jgi:hypothetical protein